MFKKVILLILCCLMPFLCAAQEKESRHSISVSTGYPWIPMLRYSSLFSNTNIPLFIEAENAGQNIKTYWLPNVTLKYSYRFTSRWEVSGILNTSGVLYGRYQYPEQAGKHLTNATPKWLRNEYLSSGVSTGVSCQYYWMDKEKWKGYSSLGAGVIWGRFGKESGMRFYPHIVPAGFHRQYKHWYLLGELALSFTGTGIIIGCGYRL